MRRRKNWLCDIFKNYAQSKNVDMSSFGVWCVCSAFYRNKRTFTNSWFLMDNLENCWQVRTVALVNKSFLSMSYYVSNIWILFCVGVFTVSYFSSSVFLWTDFIFKFLFLPWNIKVGVSSSRWMKEIFQLIKTTAAT